MKNSVGKIKIHKHVKKLYLEECVKLQKLKNFGIQVVSKVWNPKSNFLFWRI